MSMKTIRQAMAERVLIFDGACGTNLQFQHLSRADYGGKDGLNDWLVFSKPEAVLRLHESFLAVGCDVVETDSFNANRLRLTEYGVGDKVRELNVAAVKLARQACDQAQGKDGRPRFIAGSMGPTGMLPSAEDPELSKILPSEIEEIYFEQASALVEGGVDALLLETAQDMLELRAGLFACRRAIAAAGRDVLLMTQTTLNPPNGVMLLGTDIGSCMETLVRLGTDVIGLNCSTGPLEMKDSVRFLCERCPLPVSVIPNAGMPENLGEGRARYPMTPAVLAGALKDFVEDLGVDLVGGCCGTTPEHLKAVVEAVGPARPRRRAKYPRLEPAVSSMMKRVTLKQEPAPLMIGERCNSQGSRKFKQLLLVDDYDSMVALGREQMEGGAHVLDVCVALNERSDEKAQMAKLVKKLSLGVEGPLVIDSTEADVVEAALAALPGRGIVNSINLEGDGGRLHKLCPIIKKYGAAVIALTIDGPAEGKPGDGIERGMAKTRQRKLEVARRIHELCTQRYGLAPEDLIFDALTFTLATGMEEFHTSAVETMEGIRLIKKELPGVFTTLGLSNVSFGLKPAARAAVNSVFLYHCLKAGLDSCIVNPKDITPYADMDPAERELAEDLVFYRKPDALPRLIAHFEKTPAASAGQAQGPKPGEGLPTDQRIHFNIVHRIREGIVELLDESLKRHSAVEVINTILLPAMKEVGDKFGAGELILPFVLQSAEVMKLAVAHVEKFLDKDDTVAKGTVVLATVYGDVHDIGKNLVRTILANNGYVVHDLGKQVPIATILAKAEEVKADAIGLSALLVSTSKQMPLAVQELAKQGKAIPVILGGAAINRRYGQKAGFVDPPSYQSQYGPGVFYAKDAFEGLDIMNALSDPARRQAFVTEKKKEAWEAVQKEQGPENLEGVQGAAVLVRSKTKPAGRIPGLPFLGSKLVQGSEIDLAEVFPLMEHAQLFKLNWGVRAKDEAEYQRLIESEFRPILKKLQDECIQRRLLVPRAAYGYWPCRSEDNDLILYGDVEGREELLRFHFKRQQGLHDLCMADYVEEKGPSARLDVAAFSLVTVGDLAGEEADRLNKAGDYTKSLYLHGLSVQAAEGLAEWLHRRVRREWGIPRGQGLRYSPGYPAWPDMQDQEKLFKLLEPGRIGVSLTEAWQMVPEQSTSAMILHHPDCAYFSVSAGQARS
jgi:5-methyltetrahydrofolate--homocysteine methyltransferase